MEGKPWGNTILIGYGEDFLKGHTFHLARNTAHITLCNSHFGTYSEKTFMH